MSRRWLIAGIVLAIFIKISLFAFIALTRSGAILEFDSHEYLSCASVLVDAFHGQDISHAYNVFRTPGYPLFLAIFHYGLHIPLIGIIGIHLLLNVLTAWITALAARRIDPRLVPMALLIVLLDFPTTVFSLLLLTEALFILLMSILFYAAVRYLQDDRWQWVLLACAMATAAAFVRPAAYFLPFMMGGLICIRAFCRSSSRENGSWLSNIPRIGIYPGSWKRVGQALVFLVCAYAAIFSWQYRNYVAMGQFKFSSIDGATIQKYGLIGRYARGDISGKVDERTMNPVIYYVYTISRHVLDLMTEPASLKYFHSVPLKKVGSVWGYLVVIFWFPGFIAGLLRMGRNVNFWFMAAVVFYFMVVTIVAVGWETTPRFRVPMMPFIAVLSAYGWGFILEFLKKRKFLSKGERI